MPELPEVETVANGVHARVAGAHIMQVWTSGKPQTFATDEAALAEALTGAQIRGVRRVGKSIVATLATANGQPIELLVHLGMTGRLLVTNNDAPHAPHTHLVATLADGRDLRFVDPRRFGRLSLLQPTSAAQTDDARPKTWAGRIDAATGGFAGPGREPTTISTEDFIALFRGRRTAIKAALLNQSLLHGVGNIYADESLFRAGIRPRKQAGRLTRAELMRLHTALQQVLARAIELGGSSVSDYVDADGVRGFFQQEHFVYGRAGQSCRACATPLKKLVVGGRTTSTLR